MSKRVLLAWELGDGHGHVSRLLPIAEGLRARGVECIFAVRWLQNTRHVIKDRGFPFLQAPFCNPKSDHPSGQPVGAFGDILETIGFSRPSELSAMWDGWSNLFDLLQPDLMITDYSPTATLVARGRFPVVAIGDWFTIPPAHLPTFPKLRRTPLREPEDTLLAAVNQVVAEKGGKPLTYLPEVFQADGTFLVSLPELDPYATLRRDTYSNSLSVLPDSVAAITPSEHYFGYLSMGHVATRKFLSAIVDLPLQGGIFLRDATPTERQSWRDKGLTIHDSPQDMGEMARRAMVIIHHGGLGTIETVLALGRPQMFVPRHLEQVLNAEMVGAMGVAVGLGGNAGFETEHVHMALSSVLNTEKFRLNAARKAAELKSRGSSNTLERILQFCLTKLNT